MTHTVTRVEGWPVTPDGERISKPRRHSADGFHVDPLRGGAPIETVDIPLDYDVPDDLREWYVEPTPHDIAAEIVARPTRRGLFARLRLVDVDGRLVSVSADDLPVEWCLHRNALAQAQADKRNAALHEASVRAWDDAHTCASCGRIDAGVVHDIDAGFDGPWPPLCGPCRRVVARLRDESNDRLDHARRYLGLPRRK